MGDARKTGFLHVALLVRKPAFPYQLRAYLLPLSGKRSTRIGARDSHTIQVLVQSMDRFFIGASKPPLRL